MIAVSVLLGLATLPVPQAAPPRTGRDVIRSMHDRYAHTWYSRLSFVQRAIFPGKPEEEWWEALAVPGRLRIDVAPVDSAARTIIYRGDSLYVFSHGKLANRTRRPNLLLVIGFDVYRQPPETTAALLEKEGFDLARVHEDTWEGRPAYVIGATAGDTTSNQIWIDRDRLVFVRLLEKAPNGDRQDIRFTKYQRLGGGWIGTEVHFFTNGKENFTEIYRDWKINPAVTDDLFDVSAWKRAKWIPRH